MDIKKILCVLILVIGFTAFAKPVTASSRWAGVAATYCLFAPIVCVDMLTDIRSDRHEGLLLVVSFLTWPIGVPMALLATPAAYAAGSYTIEDSGSDYAAGSYTIEDSGSDSE